jgi:osmoprotectant transport system substrate-binding protein
MTPTPRNTLQGKEPAVPAPFARRARRALPILAALIAAAIGLSACSIGSTATAAPGSLAQNASLKGATFTVGSKEFTEQLVLCQITIQALQSAGATVNQHCGLNGSTTARTALTSGSIDMYWEYTGTAWVDYLQHTKPVPGAAAQYQAAAQQDLTQNHIVWLDPAPYNSTYAIVVKTSVAQQLGVRSISDYAKLVAANPSQAAMCAASEFEGRDDGLPGLASIYGFKLPSGNLATLAEGAIYNAVAKSNPCNFGEGDTTDGRIKGLGLTALTDDKQFFPIYNPALTVRQSVANANPNLAKVIDPIAKALDLATIQQLNADVDINGQQAADVARTWLQSKGFIGK